MEYNAVFEGGGMRGIGIVGALSCFEKNEYKIVNAAGTSSGALIAALVTAGYSSEEMKEILINTDFHFFMDKHGLQKIPFAGEILGLFKEKGLYSGEYMERWLNELLNKRHASKFGDISLNGVSKLKIVATDITRKKPFIIPDDLENYGYDPMEFYIARAVRMSMSIPFYFKPVKFKYKNNVSYIVDGSLCCNYPINIFDDEKSSYPTIGFKFSIPDVSNTFKGLTDPLSFLFDIASTMGDNNNSNLVDEKNINRSIIIPTLGIDCTEFNISKGKCMKLFRSGYESANEYIKSANLHCEHAS